MVHYHDHKSHPSAPILSQINRVDITPSYVRSILINFYHYNNIIKLTLNSAHVVSEITLHMFTHLTCILAIRMKFCCVLLSA
jgi:hypothetical protein